MGGYTVVDSNKCVAQHFLTVIVQHECHRSTYLRLLSTIQDLHLNKTAAGQEGCGIH